MRLCVVKVRPEQGVALGYTQPFCLQGRALFLGSRRLANKNMADFDFSLLLRISLLPAASYLLCIVSPPWGFAGHLERLKKSRRSFLCLGS